MNSSGASVLSFHTQAGLMDSDQLELKEEKEKENKDDI